MHFEAKKVIVVGGSAGIGRQVAIDVVDHGGSAVIVGRSKARVDDTVAELTSRRGQAWGIAAELTDRAAVADVQRALSEHHSDATLLVNAAGFFIPKPFLEYDPQFYDSYMELNYALFFLTQTVVEGMIARGEGGAIVNIGSMWAHQAIGVTPSCGHSMQKAGLHALTHNLAIELAGHKIRVNAVAPAAVKTPALERWVPKDEIDATLDTFAPFHPLGRVGTPADVANAVTYLLSDAGQLGHRRDSQRRRRHHGRPQLTRWGRGRRERRTIWRAGQSTAHSPRKHPCHTKYIRARPRSKVEPKKERLQ